MSTTLIYCKQVDYHGDFLKVPFLLHQYDPHWIPPLSASVKKILNKKNPFYQNAKIVFWVAYFGKKPVGRIAGIINELHNVYYKEKIAFWGYFESIHNHDVAAILFRTVEQWAVQQGMTALRGPMSPSINYECGLQLSAFDTNPFIMMPQNPPFYPVLVEQQGHIKIKDLQAWIIDRQGVKITSKKLQRIKAIQKHHDIRIRPINVKNFKQEVHIIAEIYNDAWRNNWGFLPLNVEEFLYLVKQLQFILSEDLIFVAEYSGEPCGFAVALPDINQVLQTIRNGRLLPFNFLKLIWQIKIKKVMTQGRFALLGVLQKYQTIPVGAMLYCHYFETTILKYQRFECSWILEDNIAMQSGLTWLNAQHYKTYRIYEKKLFMDCVL